MVSLYLTVRFWADKEGISKICYVKTEQGDFRFVVCKRFLLLMKCGRDG